MKKLILLTLILALAALPPGGALADAGPAPEGVTEIILAFQETYPDQYFWNGEAADFLLMVSDAAFEGLPIREVKPVDYDALRPGDIVRLKDGAYSVMIVEKLDSHATLVEVWTNGRVCWGRTLSRSAVEAGESFLTRYPE